MTIQKAREAIVQMQAAEAQDPSVLKETEAFIAGLEASAARGEPV